MNFSLYGKKRIPTPTPAQLLLLKQRQQYLEMQVSSQNNTAESNNNENKIVEYESKEEKDVIVYELGIDTESLEIPEPKLEEAVIQELFEPVAEPMAEEEAGETGETGETGEKEEKKSKNFRKNRK